MSDVLASDLARELNLPVAELLAKADRLIEGVVKRDGVDAARGMTTRTRRQGQSTVVTLSPRLVEALQGRKVI